jgi:hypothetical protein
MQALAGIHIVDGRPAPSAELARAMILRAGHTFHVVEMTGTRARVWGQRKGRPDSERVAVEWSLDMARAAGLLGRGAWQRYPRAMLVARATGDLARLLFPDVVKGLGYVAEDEPDALEAWAPTIGGGDELDKPARKPLQRRRRPGSGTPVHEVAAPVLEPVEAPEPPVAPEPDEDEAYLAEQRARAAEEARRAIEDELAPPSSVPPPYPRGHAPDDVPLPEDLRPVGTGRPLPREAPVPTSPDNEPTPAPVMPELEPEAPDDEGRGGPVLIGVRPLKALHAGLKRELGTAVTREEGHALVEAIVGHPITSTKELTRADGYRVLDYFDRFTNGDAKWDFVDPSDIGAGIRIVDTRTPPDA